MGVGYGDGEGVFVFLYPYLFGGYKGIFVCSIFEYLSKKSIGRALTPYCKFW